ncbi:MAG: hypothetical protein BGP10_15885 [Rhodanobacter sp. 68-29]|nr:hypothetical protein [Rhodanobacter sp.]ODV27877.1 MAG: hypothetical protein ABT19_01455 [Rhodanobacter sp. SCN 68-63]OJY61386.1 MAG: hypothetical protein BGP10_15885 [Rhodanobacter sp. 68-29]
MLERIISHPAARFARCRACGAEPRHVLTVGRSSREPVQFLAASHRHGLECRCGARTARHDTLANAEAEWGTDYAQLALPLRVRRRRAAA